MFKLIIFLLGLSLLANNVLVILYKKERSINQILRAENNELRRSYNQLSEVYSNLKKVCELDKQKIEKSYKRLLNKAMKKPKTVDIPIVIEKPVYVSTEDCQRLGVMIDEVFAVINN